MKVKRSLIYVLVFKFVFALSSFECFAEISDYCAVPPFISRSMAPNVMLIVDNSGSMFRFAYFDGWNTATASDDYLCTDQSNPCDEFDPNYTYYGYFDPDYWYAYSNNRFYPTALKTRRTKEANEWDGNFLNWLTMRRIDIIRKVLTGGRVVAEGGENRLVGEPPDDCNDRGRYKQVSNADSYTRYSGTVTFDVCGTTGTAYFSVDSDTYNVKVALGDTTPQGIIQRVGNKIRWGLSFYHPNTPTPQGGYVQAAVQERDNASLQNAIVNEINNKTPDSNTPLAETLWTITGYYAQEASMLGGPGPRYQSGDYQINDNVDPYNYGTGGQVLKAWCAKSFVILITDGEPCADGYLPYELRDYANGRSDFNCSSGSDDPACYIRPCDEGGYVPGIEDVALYAHINDLRDDLDYEQNLTLYTVFAFGAGSELLKYAAINGGFIDKNDNDKPDLQEEWDTDEDGVPDNYFAASSGYELEEALIAAIADILKRTSSGTAVSVLSEEAESGANLLQAVFCPQKSFSEGTNVYTLNWIGQLYNWWIYRGFEAERVNIREDTVEDKTLRLDEDYVIHFVFEDNQLKVKAYVDADGDGVADNPDPTVTYTSLDQAYDVWEAGEKLKDTKASLRTLYTNISGNLTDFTGENWSLIDDYLGSEYSGNETTTKNLISYIRGEDVSDFRSRSIGSSVWKLGDIIYSTPQIVTYYDYSVVYVGGNDGMLHAFRLGYLNTAVEGAVARLQNSRSDTNYDRLGEELWAFIPKNSLPYLRYYADPDYPHLYYVDLSPFVVEADYDGDGTIEKVLIGGMRLGGAVGCSGTDCVNPPSDTCSDPSDLDNCTGLSSYFALDISDPEAPQLMWEFTHADLGFSYSGPAVLKKGANYYAVFLSGPTNYSGGSEQNLKVFVVNLENGNLVSTIDSGKSDAFGGRLFIYTEGGPVYFGYTQEGSWKGGVLKLDTSDSNPENWTISSVVEDIGPVTVSIKRAVFGSNEWLFFGEGRYFIKDDDPSTVRYLYGVRPDMCQERGSGYCRRNNLGDMTVVTGSPTDYGWYIELDPQDGDWGTERLITDPTLRKRSQTCGEVYFATMQPNTHPCEFGGRSYIWRVEATTGGAVTGGMPGALLVQLSTGQIVEAREADIFTGAGGRKSGPYTGVPGEQAPYLLRALYEWQGTIIQWIER